MAKVAFRIAFVVLMLTFAAIPSFAQYPSCQQCGTAGGSEEAALFCVDADGWGNEECTIIYRNNFAYCRTSGAGCYQLEVRG